MDEVNYEILKFALWTILAAGVFSWNSPFINNPANFEIDNDKLLIHSYLPTFMHESNL